MVTIGKELYFEASHNLPKHRNADGSPGKCSRNHGHSYRLEVRVVGPVDPSTSMVFDFARLADIIQEHVFSLLDHQYINGVFKAMNWPGESTAENICLFIWKQLEQHIPQPCFLSKVILWETRNYYAELNLSDIVFQDQTSVQ